MKITPGVKMTEADALPPVHFQNQKPNTMTTLMLTLIVGIAVFMLFFAATFYGKVRDDEKEMVEFHIKNDFNRTCNALKFARNDAEADNIIDKFEQRWLGYVEDSYLHYFIGKLIEKQFQEK